MAKKWMAALLAIVMVLTAFPFAATAAGSSESTKPADGTNSGRPFISGSPSGKYRIPGMVTLDDGTIVAVADARWDQQQDGGGNDVITARSTDNGDTWTYTMAGYYGDNGNKFNASSTSYCDSSITTDGTNVYLLSTFFASGVAINNTSANDYPSAGTGMNESGQLVLKKSGESGYEYHVGDFSNGYAPVLDSSNNTTGYQVNDEYELYQGSTKVGCVWYSDCVFQAYKTQYLFFRKSTDGGKTWSGITLVNVKANDEVFCGAGPGRGIVLEDGTICLPVYRWGRDRLGITQYQGTSMIYSHDGGQTWSRTGEFAYANTTTSSNWSSESQLVDLGNGVIRCFYRNAKDQICYQDYTRNGTGFNTGSVVTTGIANCSDCMVSAIMYPYTIDGMRAILVSCPSDSKRTTGSIFTLLLNSDNSISEFTKKDITATGASFGYSCLTVMEDGRVADLFESGGADFSFKIYDIETLTGRQANGPQTTSVRMNLGQKKSLTFESTDISNTHPEVANVTSTSTIPGATANRGSDANYNGESVSVNRALYKLTNLGGDIYSMAHAGMYLSIGTNSKAGYPGASKATNVTIEKLDNGAFRLLQDGNYALDFNESNLRYDRYYEKTAGEYKDHESCWFYLYRRVRSGETSSAELNGYIQVSDIDSGEEYLIVHKYNNNYYILNPSTSTSNMYAHCIKANGGSTNDGYTAVVEAKSVGTTTLTAGLDTYNITVLDGDLAVTGVVKYDPVIYTHGSSSADDSDYMYCGSIIADGTVRGEKQTNYKINDTRYTIQSITCSEDPDADIKFDGSKLSGTLHLADTADYAGQTTGTTATIVTSLSDQDGNTWTQTDKLYVASNPVAGNMALGAKADKGALTKYYARMSAVFVADDSYGVVPSAKITTYPYNAKDLYTPDAMWYDGNVSTISSSAADKQAGRADNNGKSGTSNQDSVCPVTDSTNILAYYYYDKSAEVNQGITKNDASGNSFSFYMGMTPVRINSGDRIRGNATVENSANTLNLGTGLSAHSATKFSNFTQTQNSQSDGPGSATRQTLQIDGDASSVTPNTTTTLTGNMEAYINSNYDSGCKSAIHAVLPFGVIVCDKSNERTPYNEAVSKVRVSTDYTKETWDKYTTALLNTQAYLNNYTLLTTDAETADVGSTLESTYSNLTKRADFTQLEKAVEDSNAIRNKGFAGNITGDQNKYTVDSWKKFESAYTDGTQLLEQYPESTRVNVAGYEIGPDNTVQTTQQTIDAKTKEILDNQPVVAADASAYESARSLSGTIDRTAYPDSGAAINNTISTGNSTIYTEYNGKDYVNVPESQQTTVDGYTDSLLTEMNVGENSTSGRTFTVTCAVDGTAFATREQKTQYNYGTVAHIDLSAYKDSDTVCVVKSGSGIDVTETKIDLSKCNYQLALLVQQDITVTVTTATAPNVIVADYFGTVLCAFVGATSVTVKDNTVTVGDTVITAKDSPKYTFTGWSWGDGTYTVADGQVMQIVQKGTRTGGAADFTIGDSPATNAKINGETAFASTGINTPLELTSDNAKFWTRTVNGVETLASYEQNLTLFSSNVDTQFKAYTASAELPTDLQDQAMSGTPVAYGVGYFADNKFTLSCDFSAGSNVTVLEVGAVYSATKSADADLVKGGDGTVAVVSRNVAHWTDNQNSGTYTMTKKDSSTGTHYMRAYVSYRVERQGTQVPFVVYGDVYQCVNGTVTAVND